MNRLKELRQEKKLSQKEIALELQVPLRTYQRWENGESQIKPDKAQALADHFGVPVGYLLGFMVDEVTEKTIEDHNFIMDFLKKDVYIKFLDFLSSAGLRLTDKQVRAFFEQLYFTSEINEEYSLLEKDTGRLEALFSISSHYIPHKDVYSTLIRSYTPAMIDEQIKKVEKILSD
ncbi:TPA: helix-turn-helix transcriptional regulator [Streptococcus suis]|nr:helix-turn-helix transcriptional regulator [Streptococcus suis]HEM5180917.1 helix-turn-helix transcriptional regulator [Streptococcus suis]